RGGRRLRALGGGSFAEIFAGTCLALGIPCVTAAAAAVADLMARCKANPALEMYVDLDAMRVTAGDASHPISMPEAARQLLLDGAWDTTGELLAARDAIARTAATQPYFSDWRVPG